MTPPDDRHHPIRFVEDLLPAYTALRERVILLEQGTKQRFDNGAEAFVRLDSKLDEVKDMASDAKSLAEAAGMPKPIPWSKVIPIVVTIAMAGGGIVWGLARNPDRAEFDAQTEKTQIQIEALENVATKTATEHIEFRAEVRGAIKSQNERQDRIERKLDTVLQKKR